MKDGRSQPAGPPDLDDRALVAAMRRGDEAAFEVVVRQYAGRLLATATRVLRHEHDAHDAVQDAFLQAFKSLGGFEGQSKLSTWLHRIVVNCALMKLRSKRRRGETAIEDLLPAFDQTGHRQSPGSNWRRGDADDACRGETRALVSRCIDLLPENYRTVLVLRDIEELTTEETARNLGVSVPVVKTRLHRARQALRTLLDPHMTRGNL